MDGQVQEHISLEAFFDGFYLVQLTHPCLLYICILVYSDHGEA